MRFYTVRTTVEVMQKLLNNPTFLRGINNKLVYN